MKKPYIVGICGASASGKSYLLQELVRRLPGQQISLISQDNYYKPLAEQHRDEEGHVNFDHPDSIYLDELLIDLNRLIMGESITRLEYTFNNPAVTPKDIVVEPASIIILEGLFIYYLEEMRRLIDLKLFVEADEHIRLERRLRRDYEERGYSYESIFSDYRKFVAPMYLRYIAPLRFECDLIIPNNHHMNQALRVITDHLKHIGPEKS